MLVQEFTISCILVEYVKSTSGLRVIEVDLKVLITTQIKLHTHLCVTLYNNTYRVALIYSVYYI